MQRRRPNRWQLATAPVLVASIAAVMATVGADAAEPATGSTYVPVVPCRLFDTRPAPNTVGDRVTPLGEGESHRQQVTGAVGDCVVPTEAVGVTINLTAVRGTARSFLTVAPAGEPLPTASSLNWDVGSPPTPNQITVGLSDDGAIDLYNAFGNVDLVGDVVGYSTTAGLDAIEDRLDQLDLETETLTSEFNTLDDAVSTKADLDDVYTRDVINAMHAVLPSAGGAVVISGIGPGTTAVPFPGAFSFGGWDVSRVGPGTYQVLVTTRGGCSGLDRPIVQVTPAEPRLVSVDVPSCEPLGWRFFVNLRQADAPYGLTDGDWQFVMFG